MRKGLETRVSYEADSATHPLREAESALRALGIGELGRAHGDLSPGRLYGIRIGTALERDRREFRGSGLIGKTYERPVRIGIVHLPYGESHGRIVRHVRIAEDPDGGVAPEESEPESGISIVVHVAVRHEVAERMEPVEDSAREGDHVLLDATFYPCMEFRCGQRPGVYTAGEWHVIAVAVEPMDTRRTRGALLERELEDGQFLHLAGAYDSAELDIMSAGHEDIGALVGQCEGLWVDSTVLSYGRMVGAESESAGARGVAGLVGRLPAGLLPSLTILLALEAFAQESVALTGNGMVRKQSLQSFAYCPPEELHIPLHRGAGFWGILEPESNRPEGALYSGPVSTGEEIEVFRLWVGFLYPRCHEPVERHGAPSTDSLAQAREARPVHYVYS